MSDKYTLQDIKTMSFDPHTDYAPQVVHKCFAVIEQLLDDHETMRRALERYAERDNWEGHYSFDTADRALGEVTK